jgi:hypothetical protein
LLKRRGYVGASDLLAYNKQKYKATGCSLYNFFNGQTPFAPTFNPTPLDIVLKSFILKVIFPGSSIGRAAGC